MDGVGIKTEYHVSKPNHASRPLAPSLLPREILFAAAMIAGELLNNRMKSVVPPTGNLSLATGKP